MKRYENFVGLTEVKAAQARRAAERLLELGEAAEDEPMLPAHALAAFVTRARKNFGCHAAIEAHIHPQGQCFKAAHVRIKASINKDTCSDDCAQHSLRAVIRVCRRYLLRQRRARRPSWQHARRADVGAASLVALCASAGSKAAC